MPLLLPNLPIEVLANITSFLTDREVLVQLPSCGDSLFTHKLKAGGVLKLLVTMSRMSKSHIDLAHSFKLDSISIQYYTLHIDQIKSLLRGLSPDLRHIRSLHPASLRLTQSDEFIEISEPYIPVRASSFAPWIVKSTFPRLQTLRLECPGWGNGTLSDAECAFRFFRGLPPSLTDLYISGNAPIDIYQLLPPNLTAFGGCRDTRPTTKHSLDHLTSLNLTIGDHVATDDRYDALQLHPGAKSCESLASSWDVSSSEPLSLPRGLTALDIYAQIAPESPFPATLTSLTWASGSEQHYSSLLHLIPPSLSSLSLRLRRDTMTKSSGPMPRPMHHVKFFKFTLEGRSTISDWEDKLYSDLLRFVPNVEHLILFERENSCGLADHHLDLLNGASLVILRASISASCFAMHEGESLIAKALPRLQKLAMNPTFEALIDFPFGAIPPTVTDLTIYDTLSTKHLHMLPPSVTRLDASSLIPATEDENFRDLLFPPSSDLTPLHLSDDSIMALKTPNIGNSPLEALSFCKTTRRKFVRCVSAAGQLSTHLLESEDGDIKLYGFIPLSALPSSLTSLSLGKPLRARSAHLTDLLPESFPHLTYLDLGEHEVPDTIGKFLSLRTLSIYRLNKLRMLECPPNLTELIFRDKSILPKGFTLPSSLSRLSVIEIEPSVLISLVNLVSFAGRSDCLESLPTSITELKLTDFDRFDQPTLQNLFHRFTSLRILDLHNTLVSEQSMALLHDCLPLVRFKCRFALHLTDPALIASRAGLLPKEVRLSRDCDITAWSMHCRAKAFPRWIEADDQQSFKSMRLTLEAISSFVPFISEDTFEILNIDLHTILGRQTQLLMNPTLETCRLPSWIRKVEFSRVAEEYCFEALSCLPNSLRELTIPNLDLGCTALLPRDLTTLSCLTVSNTDKPPLNWPPGLTDITIEARGLDKRLLRSLPRDFKKLAVNCISPKVDFSMLPPSLTCFKGTASPAFLLYAMEHNIVWITDASLVNPIQRKLYIPING